MSKINPKTLSTTIGIIVAALNYDLLKKKEVIDWADKIIMNEEDPDIFFLELALLGSKEIKEITHHLNEFCNTESIPLPGRPLFGFLLDKFANGERYLPETIQFLYQLKDSAILSDREIKFIDELYNDHDDAISFENTTAKLLVEKKTGSFLRIYKEYTIQNFEKWDSLNESTDFNLDKLCNAEKGE